MDAHDEPFDDEALDDTEEQRIETLEMLETIMQYMDELGITTIQEARERYAALERKLSD